MDDSGPDVKVVTPPEYQTGPSPPRPMSEGRIVGTGAIVGAVVGALIVLQMLTGDYEGVEELGIFVLGLFLAFGATVLGLILCIFRGTRTFGRALLAGGMAIFAVFIALLAIGGSM